MREQVDVERVLEVLNRMAREDRFATLKLVEARVCCNRALGEDPDVQVIRTCATGQLKVGLLGVINGLFGCDERGHGPVAYVPDAGPNEPLFVRTPWTGHLKPAGTVNDELGDL